MYTHKDMKTHDMLAFGIIFLFTTKNLLTKTFYNLQN